MTTAINALEQLLNFISLLQQEKIHFTLGCSRDDIMVIAPAPSRYYEIEFFADGHVESQVFGPASLVRDVPLDEIFEDVRTAING
jgi:hypothetical protein